MLAFLRLKPKNFISDRSTLIDANRTVSSLRSKNHHPFRCQLCSLPLLGIDSTETSSKSRAVRFEKCENFEYPTSTAKSTEKMCRSRCWQIVFRSCSVEHSWKELRLDGTLIRAEAPNHQVRHEPVSRRRSAYKYAVSDAHWIHNNL